MTDHSLSEIGERGRCVVMGVVNVTPDSFSDGGRFLDPAAAIAYAGALRAEGADIIDVGGESTRPGAQRVSADEESSRVVPVIEWLVDAGIPVSIDTMRASVAEAAVTAGAGLVNDVSGGLADPSMLTTVAALDVPVVLMHWREHSDRMDDFTQYGDVVAEVCLHLGHRRDEAVATGVRPEQIVLDPGLGFAKLSWHNWALLHDLGALAALGQPILVAASRKRFLGAVLADPDGNPRAVDQRADATDAISALAAANGAWGVRVHQVRGTLDAVKVAQAWTEGGSW